MRFLFGFACAIVFAAIAGFVLLQRGYFPANADAEPSKIEVFLADMAVESYVKTQSKDLRSPFTASNEVLLKGLKNYQTNCAGCHGSPAQKDATFANSFYPKAPQFANQTHRMPEAELFWITKHGIRMSGMPAFGTMLSDEEIWKIALFLHRLDNLPAPIKAQWVSGK